ncbi:metalloproteinase inhibitor 1 [Heteronotia binoei]|uniref:metalloproteinase inhibitor 1 n=1 Tax=Heteronotia binoei TaxID=13085 RepID=UPI0029300C48|nr:metalloproteinase inhibitor 1 [Heteronotia binoei]
MKSTKMYGLLAASFLLLTLLGDPTTACSCAPRHPQTAYCNADIVIRGKFMGVSKQPMNISLGEPIWLVSYEFKAIKMYKGPEEMQDVYFLNTPSMESVCGYDHKAHEKGDYVVAGMMEDDKMMITTCSFIQPWASLSPAQRRGLSLTYSKGCNCTILPCISTCTMTSDSQCLWTDGTMAKTWDGNQAKRFACLPRSDSSGFCTWQLISAQGRNATRQ